MVGASAEMTIAHVHCPSRIAAIARATPPSAERRQNPAGPFPKMGEDRKEMKLEGFKSADVGDDLLTAIQL